MEFLGMILSKIVLAGTGIFLTIAIVLLVITIKNFALVAISHLKNSNTSLVVKIFSTLFVLLLIFVFLGACTIFGIFIKHLLPVIISNKIIF